MSRDRVIERLRKLSSGVQHTDIRAGLTGKLDSSGNLIADITDGLDAPYIWVRLNGEREATAVLNLRLSNQLADLPVLTGTRRDIAEREVIGLDPERATATFGGAVVHFASPPPSLQIITQDANTVYAGPTTGAAQAPGFRALRDLDIAGDITPTYDLVLPAGKELVKAKLVITSGVRWVVESGAVLKVG